MNTQNFVLHHKITTKKTSEAETHQTGMEALLMTTGNTSTSPFTLVIDCGETHHMFNNRSLFTNFTERSENISTSNPSSNLVCKGHGTVKIIIKNKSFTLLNCLFVPKLTKNLVSLLDLCKAPITITRDNSMFQLSQNNQTFLSGKLINKLMVVFFNQPTANLTKSSANPPWHLCLGHPSNQIIQFLNNKSEVCDKFVSKKTLIENTQDRKVKRILTDAGGEFVNHQFKSLASQSGFIHSVSPLYTPEHNGFAEHANQTKLDKARCLLLTSNLPNCYWAEEVNTAMYLVKRNKQSPYFLWTGVAPKIRMSRTFGCKVVFHVPRNLCSWKLASTGEIGIFLGITNESAYRILEISDNKVYTSRHVTFFENNFPTLNNCEESNNNMIPNTSWNSFVEEEDKLYNCLEEVEEKASISEDQSEDMSISSNLGNKGLESPPRKRIKVIEPRHPTLINSDISETNILAYPRRPTTHLTHSDPNTFNKALKSEESITWMSTVTKELNNMKELEVCEEVPIKDNYKLIGTTWVFKTKRNEKQDILEYKARLCAQGFSQTHGIDFSKTFAPTGQLNSLCTLISHSASLGLRCEQLDIKRAFLNAPLEDEVYLSIPQGLDCDKKKICFKLKKAIYGLRQAPIALYHHLSNWLIDWGFKVSKADSCVFHHNGNKPIWLFVHVDDIGVFGKNLPKFNTEIEAEFSTKILGLADLMLGIKVAHEENSITLSQCHYIDSLLDLYGMTNCKPVATALMPNTHLEAASDEDKKNFSVLNVNYFSEIGSLRYLSTATRPDLSFAVSALSQFLESPGTQHWHAFLHVLKYLKGTCSIGLTYCRNNQEPPTAYSDADWGNCRLSQQSVTGYLVTIHDNLVIWKTRKQPTVSLSSAEAKYKALTDLSCE
ncbi:hypothetical protein O181_029492 [Austropuccinia psidii MF-1]|uniref:Integrase catalytic domain-containing protein n=1 Tax=Austropuccinia psidii MF-1 TaxID=1389203 RepID=A0A9Q3H3K1_9BASI|nr:hypothetical protein [Austropuccinia psidii MF-1]